MSIRPTRLRRVVATATAVALAGGLLSLATGQATAAAKPAKYTDDFNGDGYRDYATSVTGQSVTLTYGTAAGPGGKTKEFDQRSPGIPGTLTGADGFSSAMAAADFNNDGYADLAVADPTEKVGNRRGQGMVVVVWGTKSGLGSKATTLPLKSPKADMGFGRHLAAGDFDGNGKADLAVADDQSVHIYRGGFSSKNGGTGKVTRHTPNHDALLEITGLAAGKVTKDKAVDLYVLGAGYANGRQNSGTWFLRGGSTVTAPKKPSTYNAATPDYSPEGVVADFDKDGYGDLAVNDTPYKKHAGSVLVLRGGKSGPGGSYRLTQGTAGVATSLTAGDEFGFSLSAGDTNRDGYPDLAVSAMETVGGLDAAGGVHVLRGGKKGLTGGGSQWFTRATAGVPGEPRETGMFGAFVRLRDADRDGDADLMISDNSESTLVLKGGASGITTGSASVVKLRANFPQ
ncbi:FG-GAP and VCBS repeat-containing protein [Streptomyces sp. NPDC020141]|uniref:FG-GAP and VCBS repeat-containing protein n=1 Tax=Streptomyces sp. NPDC020141 TaxID=3365065 RepID=UPI0037B7C223